ncbi:hypothetical protein HPB51_011957 [Rhipicephalus microplus]|uniref:Uncharacterized protein n=1 Tax=Rhipicephalus microplus TaxID=6941 RepID=A0A9J6F1L4_RHIMP|nr:hypothetical protein HPB51_011957 [Rhipicephalus microplus]
MLPSVRSSPRVGDRGIRVTTTSSSRDPVVSMWAQVQLSSAPGGDAANGDGSAATDACSKESPAPSSRSKHAMCISQDGCFYLLAGRSANLPLKDLWRFDPGGGRQRRWPSNRRRRGKLYVFGGEVGFASTGETPLWIFDTEHDDNRAGSSTWRKQSGGGERQRPSGRRGHTSVVYNGAMHVFGGYQDLRGSSSQLWAFRFGSASSTTRKSPFARKTPLAIAAVAVRFSR